jgi:alkyl sulfatase BDS1-like metallo-beta-lactamase superfamily hydrolase
MRFVEGDSGPIVIDLLISSETATAAFNLYREHWGDRRVISVICSPQPRWLDVGESGPLAAVI